MKSKKISRVGQTCKHRFGISLDVGLHDRIKEFAASENRNVSNFIENVLDIYLSQVGQTQKGRA